jgi:toxin ParE1/3/4
MATDLRVRLSFDAEQDFDDILDYSFQQFSEEQALAYRRRVEDALTSIGRYPQSGKLRSDYGDSIRCRIVGEHRIIYRVRSDEVLV